MSAPVDDPAARMPEVLATVWNTSTWESEMNRPWNAWALSAACAATLCACGGGGGDSAAPPPPPAAQSVKISGVAADGPLQGATACYDLNNNGACDSGEPSSSTDANGNFSFDVDAAAAGQHRVVVAVPATAIDKDTGAAVGTAFTLQSPATGTTTAHSVFASPLTTLVQAHADATGATVAAASDFVKTQAGLSFSPLADFTASTATDARQAATVARLVTLTQQKQTAALATVVGQADISGSTITAADVDKAVTQALLGSLPALGAASQDPSVAAATTSTELQAALGTLAQTLVDTQTGLSADNVKAIVGVAKMPPDASTDTPTAGATLRALTYTDANHWFYRAMEASVADNTPVGGLVRFYDMHHQATTDVFGKRLVYGWGAGNTKAREADQHWNGTAWVTCSLGQRGTSTVRDAMGRSSYNYCDHREDGNSQRVAQDISGKTLRSVIEGTVRAFPGGDSTVPYASFGPADLNLLGTTAFPSGSTLWYYTNQSVQTAFTYDVASTNWVSSYAADIAAGGDARSTSGLACAGVTSANSASLFHPVDSLDTLVARYPGKPCVFNKGTNADGSSLDPNEWWGNSTVSLGSLVGAQTQPTGTSNYYNTTLLLRVGFAATGNGATFYGCYQRKADGSPRNCSVLGTGTYGIQTLGDARVLSFTGLPAITQRTGFNRVFVERGGKVYFGFQSVPGAITHSLRFNLAAANAILGQLGLQPIVPQPAAADADAAKSALLANAKGTWGGDDSSGSLFFRFGDGGQFIMAQTSADTPSTQPGLELGTIDIDPVTGVYHSELDVDTNWEAGTSHPEAGDVISAITATQIVTPNITIDRLAGGTSGIVGTWAWGSATNLKTIHVVFYASGTVVLIDPVGETDTTSACFAARQGPPGIERASYTFNAATGALHVFNKTVDTNGCGGFFDSSEGAILGGTANTVADVVVTFSGDGKSLSTDSGETFYRVTP